MAYAKTTWNAGIAPGISAANLNNLETQYDEAVTELAFHTRSTTMADLTQTVVANAALAASTWEDILNISGAGPYFFMGGLVAGDSNLIDTYRITIDGAAPQTFSTYAAAVSFIGVSGAMLPMIYAATSLRIEIHNGDGVNPHAYQSQLWYRS